MDSKETKTPNDVSYLEDIDKSRRVIDQLNLLPDKTKKQDFEEIIEEHLDRIRFYLNALNEEYKKIK